MEYVYLISDKFISLESIPHNHFVFYYFEIMYLLIHINKINIHVRYVDRKPYDKYTKLR